MAQVNHRVGPRLRAQGLWQGILERCVVTAMAVLLAWLSPFLSQASAQSSGGGDYAINFGGEVLTVEIPQGLFLAYEDRQQGQSIAEFLPARETLVVWSEMVTVTTASFQRPVTAIDFLSSMASGLEEACLVPMNADLLGRMQVESHDAVIAYFSCAQTPAAGVLVRESFTIIAIEGNDGVATVQWAVRDEPTGAVRPFDERFWGPRMARMPFSLLPR